jgi:hypothetical protein
MGVEEGEVLWLEGTVPNEVDRLEAFEDKYKRSASAFVEKKFSKGVEDVYNELPNNAVSLPRYVDPPEVSEAELIQLSDQAVCAKSFADIRVRNLNYVLEELDQDFKVLGTSSNDLRSVDVSDNLSVYLEVFEELADGFEGVAMFLDSSDELPGQPFNGMKELHHGGDEDRIAVKKVDPSDLSYPLDNYWPFTNSETYFSPLN